MGWDYYTYVAQPVFFLDAVKDFLVKEQKAKIDSLKRQQKQNAAKGRR